MYWETNFWSAQAMLAPFLRAAMLRAACGRSMASPTESGSTAPALQRRSAVHSTANRSKATVLPGGKIEVPDQALPSGEVVDVIILLPAPSAIIRRLTVDILTEAPGQRLFKTAAEVDDYLRKERDAWDR
jgi:hypothetical protein